MSGSPGPAGLPPPSGRPRAYVRHESPSLEQPVLVVMLNGWIDAGAAAAAAMARLDASLDTRPLVTFDAETYLDYRARRPLLQLRDGVNTGLVWPDTVVKVGRDGAGHDVLLLTGHEPDAQWRRFCDEVVGLSMDMGVRLVVGLGAYPFAAPHTRPSRVSITANSPELAASLPYLRNSVDVPAGVEAALERRFAEVEVPAVGLWAQVPHYVANMPYPAATQALLAALSATADLVVDRGSLDENTLTLRARLDELVANSNEHQSMVSQLEAVYDAEAAAPPQGQGLGPGPLPTGDELAAELERFLRDQGP